MSEVVQVHSHAECWQSIAVARNYCLSIRDRPLIDLLHIKEEIKIKD